ncbi:MAG: flagellin FliC [Bdellovibrionaceae bacterium]|nr:flagellin FliC [Pseudobdellovibrionaceae bacterium]
MALTLRTNVPALNAQFNLNRADRSLRGTYERISSGKRINRAADDAAGLAISDQLRADIRSLVQGVRNAEDGLSLVQVYEGGTHEISDMLIRLRELAMQAATDTVSDRERSLIMYEVEEIKREVDRIAYSTKFIGQSPLLAGEELNLQFQVGKDNDEETDRILFDPGNLDLTASGLNVDGLDFSERDSARDSLEVIDEAIFDINSVRARVGSSQSRLETTINSGNIQIENLSAAQSRILDADMAAESTDLMQREMLRQAGTMVLAAANQSPSTVLKLLNG